MKKYDNVRITWKGLKRFGSEGIITEIDFSLLVFSAITKPPLLYKEKINDPAGNLGE